MKRRSIKTETVDSINRKLEEEMRSEAAGPSATQESDVDAEGVVYEDLSNPNVSGSPWPSRISSLEARVMMLQERVDDAKVEGKTEILVMLADLFDAQISAALTAAGCQPTSNATSKDYALGFGSTLVKANSSANISVQPQVVFRPERLVIPASIADDFIITDIKVGKNSQLVSTGAIPAAAFTSARSEANCMMMDTAQISMFVTVSVTNTSDKDRYFQCVIFGPSVDPSGVSSAKRFSARRFW